jgi:hypothetical protein
VWLYAGGQGLYAEGRWLYDEQAQIYAGEHCDMTVLHNDFSASSFCLKYLRAVKALHLEHK